MPNRKISPGKKIQILNGVILVIGLVLSFFMYVNPPALNWQKRIETGQTEYAENAWMLSALISVSLVLIIYSVYILRKNRKSGEPQSE